jgi:hypothetical protein
MRPFMATKKQSFLRLALGLTTIGVLGAPIVASAGNTTAVSAVIGSTISISNSNASTALNVTPTASTLQTTAKDTTTVNTNDTNGYQLTVQANVAALSCSSGGCTGNNIAAGSGSCASPAALAADTWGYRIVTGASVNTALFPCNTTVAFGTTVPSVGSNQAVTAEVYAALPTASADIVKQTSATATNDATDIYYKDEVSTSKPTGTYNGVTVTYAAVAR